MKSLVASLLLLSLSGMVLAETADPSSTPAAAGAPAAPAATDITAPPADAAPAEIPGPRIYLVTRIKLTGTDLTQVVFLQHPAMNTMEACETERTAGLMNNWGYFGRYYLKTLKGVSYKVDYRCVEGEQRLSYWRKGVFTDNFYLVRTGDGKLQVSKNLNFFACRDALRAITREEGIDSFCAISSQSIVQTPAP